MSLHPCTERQLPYIVDLAAVHATELGFIPRQAMAAYVQRGRVTLARENGDPCGFFLTSGLAPRTRIFQACVQRDARGLGHAIDLLGDLLGRAAVAGVREISLHCRDGLESNGFWSACGFQSGGLILGGTARRKIVHDWRLRIIDAVRDPSLPYGARILESLSRRAAENPRP